MANYEIQSCDINCQNAQSVVFETGILAEQASGAVTVRSGDSVVFAAVVASKEPKEGTDFLPLTVDYIEKSYAAGKIPGGFFKREGRASTTEILCSRLIDRPLRPMFPEHYHNDLQVAVYVLSYDKVNPVDILAINAASAAFMISEVPIIDAVAAKKRVVKIDGVGQLHVMSSFNNVIVTMANADGQVISWSSAGKMGFRGSKKNTPYAAQMAAQDCGKVAFDLGLRKVKAYVKGPGQGRESAIRACVAAGIEVTEIIDVTPMPHNGCRPPKRRRV